MVRLKIVSISHEFTRDFPDNFPVSKLFHIISQEFHVKPENLMLHYNDQNLENSDITLIKYGFANESQIKVEIVASPVPEKMAKKAEESEKLKKKLSSRSPHQSSTKKHGPSPVLESIPEATIECTTKIEEDKGDIAAPSDNLPDMEYSDEESNNLPITEDNNAFEADQYMKPEEDNMEESSYPHTNLDPPSQQLSSTESNPDTDKFEYPPGYISEVPTEEFDGEIKTEKKQMSKIEPCPDGGFIKTEIREIHKKYLPPGYNEQAAMMECEGGVRGEDIRKMHEMGFDLNKVIQAMLLTHNDVSAAIELLKKVSFWLINLN
jgi:hypothetical protein